MMSRICWLLIQYHPHCLREFGSLRELQTSLLRFYKNEMYLVSRTKTKTCCKLGWLHRMQMLGDQDDKEVYLLPSKLHEKHES
ncbi:hypothetical protein BDW67DRAFT_58569 [Aspergillus spinulosporus]